MEDVLEVYARPYDPRRPVVCMDETNKQLIGEVREPLPVAPGQPERVEHEYVRNGVAQIFLEVEPLTGRCHVEAGERRTRQDWARWIEGMLERRYPEAERVVLVMDNLNTHGIESLYATYEPRHARQLAERLEIHYTPKHGSWLNIAEIELSTLCGQCLDRRIPSLAQMQREIEAWVGDRNQRQAEINWQFTTEDARIKRIGKRVRLMRPTQADVEALLRAWSIRGRREREALVEIARKPGGLRGVTKTLRLAGVFADGQAVTVRHLQAACRDLGGV